MTHRVSNAHTHTLNNLGEKLESLDHTTTAVGEGLKLAVSCVDANIKALDEHVDHCCQECKTNEALLNLYWARLNKLEKVSECSNCGVGKNRRKRKFENHW